jgi:hypothetical protein
MLNLTETERVLNEFVNYVVRESKKRAPKASGDLKKSIRKGKIVESKNSIQATILAEDYLPYIDKGVSGTKTKYNTPFSYTNKKPPVKFLRTWLKRKTGKFLARDRNSAAFALQNHIFMHGIKPTRFFTTPLENAFKQLPDDIIEAYGLDVEGFLSLTLKDNIKK